MAQVSYDTAASTIGRRDLELLSIAFQHMRGQQSDVPRDVFIQQVAQSLGATGYIAAARLFDLMDSSRSRKLSFEQFVVGVYVFT